MGATRADAYHVGLLLLLAMLSALEISMSVGHRFHTADAQVVAGNATRTIMISGAHIFNVNADIFIGMLMNSSSWTRKQELKAQCLIIPKLLGTLTAVLRAATANLSLMESRILWGEAILDAQLTGSTTIA